MFLHQNDIIMPPHTNFFTC